MFFFQQPCSWTPWPPSSMWHWRGHPPLYRALFWWVPTKCMEGSLLGCICIFKELKSDSSILTPPLFFMLNSKNDNSSWIWGKHWQHSQWLVIKRACMLLKWVRMVLTNYGGISLDAVECKTIQPKVFHSSLWYLLQELISVCLITNAGLRCTISKKNIYYGEQQRPDNFFCDFCLSWKSISSFSDNL